MTWYTYAGTSIVGATGDTPDSIDITDILVFNGVVDAASKNLPANNIAKWNIDTSGRVVSTIGTDGTITTYTYN